MPQNKLIAQLQSEYYVYFSWSFLPQKEYNIIGKGTEKDKEWMRVDTISLQRMIRILQPRKEMGTYQSPQIAVALRR